MTDSATIPRSEFLAMLRFVGDAISATTTLPFLSHVLIDPEDGKLCLRTTNLDFHLKHRSAIDWRFGAVTVDHRRLKQFISAAQSPELLIQAGKTVRFTCGDSEADFNTLEAEDFPPWPGMGKASEVWSGQSEELCGALTAVIDSASVDIERYITNGIFFDGENAVVATNGRTLALARLSNLVKIIVPAAPSRIMTSITNGGARLTASESYALLDAGTKSIASRLIEGNFPNYKPAIPQEHTFRIVLPREEFLDKTKLCQFATTDRCSAMKLVFTKNNLRMSSGDPSLSSSRSDIATNGDFDTQIALAPHYLVTALSKIKSDSVVMKIQDELSGLVLRPEGDEQAQLHIIMPMRLT